MGESRVVIPIFGILDVTGEVIGMWVILAAVTVISLLATRHMRERPGKFQNVIETGVEYLDNYFAGILGKKESRKHLLFLGSLFIFIIFGNYTGLIPGAGLTDYWKAPTSSLSVTLGLSIITFFYLQGSSIHARGFLGYLKRFISPSRSCCRCSFWMSSSSPRRWRCVCSAISSAKRPSRNSSMRFCPSARRS